MIATCGLNNGNSAPPSSMSNPWYPPPPGPSFNFIMDTPPSNSREQRNRAEKNRRDKINAHISELANMLSLVSKSSKRCDKTSILRLTANELRLWRAFLYMKEKAAREHGIIWPRYLSQNLMDNSLAESRNVFLGLVTLGGKLMWVSQAVELLLGYQQCDMMGQQFYTFIAPEDHDRLRQFMNSMVYGERDVIDVRMKRAGPRTESPVYEIVTICATHGKFVNPPPPDFEAPSTSRVEVALAGCDNLRTLTLMIKVFRAEPIHYEATIIVQDEYVTRHLIDGRIISCDQRISFIAGYLTEEVSGLSAFKFMHRDDVRWVMIALRQMYDRGERRGSSCYRLMSRNGRFIYLKTSGYLEIDPEGTVETFICVNKLVAEPEGLQLIAEMKKKFSALISPQSSFMASESESSVESVEDPQQLDVAIVHLMTNLPTSPSSDHRSTPSPIYANVNENQDCSSTTTEPIIKPYQMKIKTAPKRPPSTEEANLYKRQRTSPQLSPLPSLASPYQTRPHSSSSRTPEPLQHPEIDQSQPELTLYQQDELNHDNV